MDKFTDAKQVLELKDVITFGANELVVSTVMLEEPKLVHGRRYWFETYVIELGSDDGKIIFGKLGNQYLTAYEAIQGHRLTTIMLQEVLTRAESAYSKQNDSSLQNPENPAPTVLQAPDKPKKGTKGLDKT